MSIHRYATFWNALFSRMQKIPEKFMKKFGDELSTVAILMVTILYVLLNNSTLLNPVQKHPSTLTWIHRYATFCNALFLRMQRIPEKFMQKIGDELSNVATLMFSILHVLFNSSALFHPVQSYHSHSRQYTNMQPFTMHCFQGCRGSLKSLWKI